MTAANLAVIFGPNLLQREGGDASPQIYAMGIEDSTAIISVTLVLIQNYRRLFTVRQIGIFSLQILSLHFFSGIFQKHAAYFTYKQLIILKGVTSIKGPVHPIGI